MDNYKEDHPSYGQLQISRVTCSHGVPLYGSSSKFREVIKLSISHSEYNRSLHRAWYFPKDTIVEVEMSPSQFAEAITSLNCGGGVPVTIKRIEKDWKIPEPPFKDERDLFHKEFNEGVQKIFNKTDDMIQSATDMLEQKTISKKAFNSLIGNLAMIRQDIESNMPFLAKSFNEHIDKTVSSAKVEIETFIEHKIHNAGLEALQSHMPETKLIGQ